MRLPSSLKLVFTSLVLAGAVMACANKAANQSEAAPKSEPKQSLAVTQFTAAKDSIFNISSFIISGEKEAILIDAQFQKNDAQRLAQQIKDSGKTLTTVFISHSDPDFYFGLDVIQQNFPAAKILSTASTVKAINASKDGKVAFWGPILGDNAPSSIVVPEVFSGDKLVLDNQEIIIDGLNGKDSQRIFLWLPQQKIIISGINATSQGSHLWMADTPSLQQRNDWIASLNKILQLKPTRVYPSHYNGDGKLDSSVITGNIKYLQDFNAADANSSNSAELIKLITAQYPDYSADNLELGAKVVKGEMEWN